MTKITKITIPKDAWIRIRVNGKVVNEPKPGSPPIRVESEVEPDGDSA